MSLMQNMALFFRSFTESHQISLSKLREMTELSRGSIYAYSKGEGNPTISTWEHIAWKLHVDPIFIAMGVYDLGSKDVYVLLWHTMHSVTGLSPEDRRKFLKLFTQEVLKLWDKE